MKYRSCLFFLLFLSLVFAFSTYQSGWASPAEQANTETLRSKSVVQLVKESRQRVAENNLGQALKYAREAVSADPAYADAHKQLGRVLILQGNHSEALAPLQIAADLNPGDPEVKLWILRLQARSAVASGQFNSIIAKLQDLSKSNPDNEEIRTLLADVYSAQAAREKGGDVSELLARIAALEPQRGGAWRDLGWTLFTRNKYEEAVEAWNKALIDVRVDRKALLEQAVAALVEQKQIELAKTFYRRWEPNTPFLSLGLRFIQLNRLMAAREILALAWDKGENHTVCGLYLAYTEARSGSCTKISERLEPFFEKIAEAKQKEIDIYLKTLQTCSFESSAFPFIAELETVIGKFPDTMPGILDTYEKTSNERRALRDYENAYSLLKNILKHDPNRVNVWLTTRETALNTGHQDEIAMLLQSTLSRSSSVAVKEGIKGLFAEENGELLPAVAHYRKSLAAELNQPDLRFLLFNTLVALKDFQGAEKESHWFKEQVASGNASLKSNLANILATLGKTEDALAIWQELYLTIPDNPYYATETARCLFSLCRAEEAVSILEQSLEITPAVKSFELLAEIESTLGNTKKAFEVTTEGLNFQFSSTLLRIRAETADALNESAVAEQAARKILETDRGNVAMSLILGRALSNQNRTADVAQLHRDFLARNPSFLPSLIQLREIHSSGKEPQHALAYATELTRQRPWDAHAHLSLAMAQVEADNFLTPLQYLRTEVRRDIRQTTPVLIYDDVLTCSYKGRNNIEQVTSHLKRLSAEGYRFVTPDEIPNPKEEKQTVIIISNSSPDVVRALDKVLVETGGKAIYAASSGTSEANRQNYPLQTMLLDMQTSGRWLIGSSGLAQDTKIPIDKNGTTGNPLTHRRYESTGTEDLKGMKNRIDETMNMSSANLKSSKIFLYPKGDYGQMSLDTNQDNLETLQSSIKEHFQYAIASDSKGFSSKGFDPSRIPGRFVPSEWNADTLVNRLKHDNPLVRARLELAKTLYLHSQHERANTWFRTADLLGSDPEEVNFFWGSNAHIEGDLPTALDKLRRANEINPDSQRNKNTLERSERKKAPLIDVFHRGWSDNDDRTYSFLGSSIEGHVTDNLLLEFFADRNRWARDGIGHEDGNRVGMGTRWYYKEEQWLDARFWYMNIPHVDDMFGGLLRVHVPNEPWGGYVNFQFQREEVDTVEAIRKRIMANGFSVETYSRIRDQWDLYADLGYSSYTDGNNTFTLDGIFMKRLHEWPFLGLGYRFTFGESSRDPDEYWSPQGLQQHELYMATRGEYGRFRYTASAEAGFAHDRKADWRFVWGTRIDLAFFITPDLSVHGRYSRRETPNYYRNAWTLGIAYRF